MRTENGRSEEEVVAATPARSETLHSPRASHRCPPPLRHEASFTPTVHQQRSEREISQSPAPCTAASNCDSQPAYRSAILSAGLLTEN